MAERLRALFLNQSIISPLCLVWVRAPLRPHVRQAKFKIKILKLAFRPCASLMSCDLLLKTWQMNDKKLTVIFGENSHKIAIRGWFRKFCHTRCYYFVNIHDRLLYYTLIERATFLLYNDAKTMHEQNKYFALKDTWGKTTGTFS